MARASYFLREAIPSLTTATQLREWHTIARKRLLDLQGLGWPDGGLQSFRDDIAAVERRMAELGHPIPTVSDLMKRERSAA